MAADCEALSRLVTEADALVSCSPRNVQIRNGAAIVYGYVEAAPWYEVGAFPLKRVQATLRKMRESVPAKRYLQFRALLLGKAEATL